MSDFDWSEHLWPGERVLWSGRPRGGLFINDFLHDIAFVLPSIVVLWIGTIFVTSSVRGPEALVFIMFGVVFIAIAARPLFKDRKERLTSHFVITNHRAISASPRGRPRWIELDSTIEVIAEHHLIFFGAKSAVPLSVSPGSFAQRRHWQYSFFRPQYRTPGGGEAWVAFPDVEDGFELQRIVQSAIGTDLENGDTPP